MSSDRNHPGDTFTTVLAQPLVAEGWVVARAGQTAIGRVSTVQKSDHLLGIELGEVILVDGLQAPIRTPLLQYSLKGAHDHAVVPGTAITFRLDAPLTVVTERSPQAFLPVTQEDYQDRETLSQAPQTYRVERPYYEPYSYGSYYGPYYGGPYFGFYGTFGRAYPRSYYNPRVWSFRGGWGHRGRR